MIKGNIGDWSEFYAFTKILTDGVLYSANKNLEKMPDNFYYVLKIIREETGVGEKIYVLSKNGKKINILNSSNKKIGTASSAMIKKRVKQIFEAMQDSQTTTFSIKMGQQAMAKLHCSKIKASSAQKKDIIIKIHDPIAPISPELGFSIKSTLGEPSTLVNSSGATNFCYRIRGGTIATRAINSISSSSKIRDRVKEIEKRGGELLFENLDNENFRSNLRKIDSVFPEILAEILKAYFQGKGKKLSELVSKIAESGTLEKKFDLNKADLEFKLKSFLVAYALGMTAGTKWDGITRAHGGYIIVKDDGEIVCYNLYNRDEFQEYLYKNVALDTPSTSRHGFGKVFSKNGEKYIKFNLQIRFIKQ